jgi:O-antigen ligase
VSTTTSPQWPLSELTTVRPGAPPYLPRVIDGLAVATAISLPWSTTASGILIALWIFAYLPTLDLAALRRVLATPAGGLPVLLWALGVLGMLWADVPWGDRFGGVGSFHRLLLIPLLLAHYRRSDSGRLVVGGYLLSCLALLGLSLATHLWPGIWRPDNPGVPVHNQITQSGEFMLCAFGLSQLTFDDWRSHKPARAAAAFALALLFLADVAFIATSRTELVVIAVLMIVGGMRQWGFKGAVSGLAAFIVLAVLTLSTSAYLRGRVYHGIWEVQEFEAINRPTSIGLRLEWLYESLELVAQAPLLGHGTGSIRSLFPEHVFEGRIIHTTNPHNQTIAVAVQLGLVGTAILLAMWGSHVLLFRGPGLCAWIGLLIVVQNLVGSLFNSHLFDFVEGWTYVWGVGVIGGIELRAGPPTASAPQPAETGAGQTIPSKGH